MGRVHFGTFRNTVRKAYKGRARDAKKIIHTQLKDANLTGSAFPDFLEDVKAHALKSADAEKTALYLKDSDDNIESSLQAGNGDADKAAAFHFYFLCHDKYVKRANALNDAIKFADLMNGELDTTVFGFGFPSEADGVKRIHPVPARPSGPFHWPLYVSEKDARSASLDDEGVWLNPLNHYSITLSHRQTEIALLDAFVGDDRPFLICALVAPSGAGKTRLVSEWMRKFVPDVSDTDWDAGFVTDRKSEPWATWDITRKTVTVIDYTYAYDEVMKAIAERCRYHRDMKLNKVRLLVIDHLYPQVLQADFFWSRAFPDQGSVDSRKSAILSDRSPIRLQAEEAGSSLLREMIAATASSQTQSFTSSDPEMVRAESILWEMGKESNHSNTEAVRHPLFAALLGQAIRGGRQDYMKWSRRDLIMHYFAKPSRLPWLLDNDGEQEFGIWIGVYVAAATLFREVPFEAVRPHLPKRLQKIRTPFLRLAFIEGSASRIVSSSDGQNLKALEPDILGENFMISFFNCIERDDKIAASFRNILTRAVSAYSGSYPAALK